LRAPGCLFGAAAILASGGAFQAGQAPARTSAIEQRLVRFVDEHNPRALELLERLVRIDSGTMNFDGVREVGAALRGELDRLGFQTRWVDGAAVNRAGTLVARHAGHGPLVLLIGHLDTVFDKDGPFHGFERLPGNRARGPGVIDMKGGDVILVQALAALADAGLLAEANITVVLSGDEENAGVPLSESRKALREAAQGAAYALGFEDGDGRPERAVIARRGSARWRLDVTGKPAHSSQVFSPGVGTGAIYEAARVLREFQRRLAGERYLTFNPGIVLGGTAIDFDADRSRGTAEGKSNVVSGRAVVQGDLRTVSPEQLDAAQRRMRAIASASLPHTSAVLSFEEGYPPMAPTEGNRRLLALYDRVSRDLGFGPVGAVDPADAGAADVSFVAAQVTMSLDALGLKGEGGHTVEETADLATLGLQTKRAAVLLQRLLFRGRRVESNRTSTETARRAARNGAVGRSSSAVERQAESR
jgi:glutamate carboxypeptidase